MLRRSRIGVRLRGEQLQRCYLSRPCTAWCPPWKDVASTSSALGYAWRLVGAEPLDESAQRQVMRLLALTGRRAEAAGAVRNLPARCCKRS